jgi:type I restriction enzyme M protein
MVLQNILPSHESSALIRDLFASFLLLRLFEQAEAEQEAVAIFEGRIYEPMLPSHLHWRQWIRLQHPNEIGKRLRDLAQQLELLRGTAHPVASWLYMVAQPLRRMLEVDVSSLHDLVRWVGELPFETPGERRALLEVFDQVVAKIGDPYDGENTTPANIARLVAALADPQPGERVYDPCFGSGNFLVAAWQHAERNRNAFIRTSTLLEVAGIEINASTFLIGLTRMLLAGIECPHLELGDSLEREAPSSPGRQGFDVVVANPPIGLKTSRESWRYRHYAILPTDTIGLFVQHALSQLKLHGRAVIAVPDGFLFRGGADRQLRRTLLEQGQIEAVVGLPAGSYAPYTNIKASLLVLSRKGGVRQVRMVDTTYLFNHRSSRRAPLIHTELAEQLAMEVRRPEMRKPSELPPGIQEGMPPGASSLSRSIWEASVEQLASAEWDLSPRRREKGGLDELLSSVKNAMGETSVVPLSTVVKIMPGRAIRSADLQDEPPIEKAIGYVRIKDLSQGRVEHPSSWLRPSSTNVELSWTLLPGDVLLSRSGTIGKVALVRNGAVGSVPANGLYVLRADQNRLDAGFLLAYLLSPACQNWLTAQSRGTVIQHLNRTVLERLPVPLPPLRIQVKAAVLFRELGTDALAFLSQGIGTDESDRLTSWLADLNIKTPAFIVGFDETPPLTLWEPLVTMAKTAQRWMEFEEFTNKSAYWLRPLISALLPLAAVTQIPPGSGLLSVLQDAARGMHAVLEHAIGNSPAEAQARAIGERLRDWLHASISDLVENVALQVGAAPASLAVGSFAEFAVELVNKGALPLRTVGIETTPDWGTARAPYLAENGSMTIHLSGDVPKLGGQLTLRMHWQALTLTGQAVTGELELAFRIVEAELSTSTLSTDLGGSPYVTGSPLEPEHGHEVFFGREELIGQISRYIATQGNVVLLEGNRRTGKTSILRHLEGRTAIPGWLAVYCSMQGAGGASEVVGVPTAEVFREIARSIAAALNKLGIEVPLPNGQIISAGKPALGIGRACREGIGNESPFADFRDYLETLLPILKSLGLGLVLMLDEFDKLQEGIGSGVTSPQVPENIRFMIQTYPKLSAILTGSRRLKRLRKEYWSALYGLGTSIPVTSLDMQSARSVVTEPVRDKLTFSDEAIEYVIEGTARHPYLMQCLCNRVFDYAVQTKVRSITLGIVNDAAHHLVRDNEHFAFMWDHACLGPPTGRQRRQLILFLLAQSFKQGTQMGFGTLHEQLLQKGVEVDEEALDADIAYLRELELIEFSGQIGNGQYRLAIPLMADWVEQREDIEVVASRARTEAEEEDVES